MTSARRRFGRIAFALILCLASGWRAGAADSVLYRVFLLDGTALVSYGEFARVADRVVFSIPLGDVSGTPALQLVSIPQTAVDWERTSRYADAVRAHRYGETRGEIDFALLGGRVAEALNLIALTSDPARRLAMAEEARANLARWPGENFGYHAAEVAELTGMLDDVIADLRAAAGQTTEVTLVTNTVPPAEALLAPPDFRDTIEQAMAAASLTPEPAERVSLLRAIVQSLQEPARGGGWASALHARASADLAAGLRIEKAYADLSSSSIASATSRAARGDVGGVQGVMRAFLKNDDRLGHQRPQEATALLALLDLRLAEARRLRLAQDAWASRAGIFKSYRAAIEGPVDELRSAKKSLVAIRELAGPSPKQLPRLEQRLMTGRQMLAAVWPPAELEAAHGLFRAAFQMAGRAASVRRNAVSSRDMKLAWDAASAAAGALMLLDRAIEELDRQTSQPTHR